MSSTSKARLQDLLKQLDTLFTNAHPSDVPELVEELREDLRRRNSAAKRPGYDRHTTGSD